MYYEEKVINGELYWRGNPDGEWIQVSRRDLTAKLLELRQKYYALIDEADRLQRVNESLNSVIQDVY
jgi:hypothetical protein